MDSFFGIGFPELVLILILAGLVLGPKRIREVARTLGRLIGQMQAISNQFKRQLNAELDALDSEEMRGAVQEMKQLRREVDDLRKQVRSIPEEVAREGRQAVTEGETAFKPVSRSEPQPTPSSGTDSDGAERPAVPTPDDLPKPIEVPDDPQ
ncbi:MAG TPA: twin-arginine translocase TatA/TatE family subunit [Candidatus Sulfomarinibacteraceae bacterium]|nr:twin-arginine translocase TatA/TatE family subunit [Candidatus Sulfomarinibacteraceae bacterium]